MAYVGGDISSWFGPRSQAATKAAAMRMAAKGSDRMHELAAQNTPVKTGNLRTAWYSTPVVEVSYVMALGYRSEVRNDISYAAYVEHGTGVYGPRHRPYVIEPRTPGGVLAWRDPKTGRWVHAKRVLHPGSPGNHMLALAAHVVEAETDDGILMDGVLREWAREVEAAGD